MAQAPPPADMTLQRTSRDAAVVRARLTEWLATVLPDGADPAVVLHSSVQENGLSSETVPLDVTWTEEGQQQAVVRLVIVATLLLAAGMAFAYWVVLPNAVPFLLDYDSDLYNAQVRARDYYSFVAITILGCGVLFELPIFILGLVRLGIVSAGQLRSNRRIGVGLCIIAVVLLPGVDFVSMGLQALPILILFEGSIWAATYFERRWEQAGVLPEPLTGTGDS